MPANLPCGAFLNERFYHMSRNDIVVEKNQQNKLVALFLQTRDFVETTKNRQYRCIVVGLPTVKLRKSR